MIQMNSIKTIRAITGYIENHFGIRQLVVRQARFATSRSSHRKRFLAMRISPGLYLFEALACYAAEVS